MREKDARAAAALLVERKQRTLEVWERRVRESVPAARQQTTPALLDSVPQLLDRLVLACRNPSPLCALEQERLALAAEHGRHRARLARRVRR